MINFNALEAAKVYDAPFRFITAEGALTKAQAGEVRRDYPTIDRSGYLPLTKLDVKGAFASLIDDLQSKRLAEILSDKLSLDLVDKPRMITVRKLSKIGDGRVHNDSVSKITTMLIYLNDDWDPAEGGAIRALNGPDDMDDFSLEFPPLAGNVFACAVGYELARPSAICGRTLCRADDLPRFAGCARPQRKSRRVANAPEEA